MNLVPVEELPSRVRGEPAVSEWLTIEQDRINAFADTTIDHQFIHVDEAAAKATPWGTTIAHGYLTLSLLSHFLAQTMVGPEGSLLLLNYGLDRVRFLEPVAVGSRIRARTTLVEASEKSPGRWLCKSEVVVEIDGRDKPALIAEPLTMFVMS